MKISNILFATIIAGALLSCKKENTIELHQGFNASIKPHSSKLLVKEIFSGYYADTISFAYNAQDRLITSANKEDQYSFIYNNNTVNIKDWRPLENRDVYDLSANLNADNTISGGQGSVSYLLNSPYNTNTTFIYDNQGYLIKKTDARTNAMIAEEKYFYAHGDLIQINYYENGVLVNTFKIEYSNFLDKTNISIVKFDCLVDALFGKSSLHLISNIKVYNTENLMTTNEIFTYQLDAGGYPVSGTIDYGLGHVVNVKYSYNK
ncbi:MAG: hypothetical protein ABIN67_04535 [Ferruginibacter sp.]